MPPETHLREQICMLAKSVFDRGLTGNIAARTQGGGLLVSPTGTSFGSRDPVGLSRFDPGEQLVEGDPPTTEMQPHAAFYDTRLTAGAVVLLHSNDGPVVADNQIKAACNAVEELEDTARLAMMARELSPRALSASDGRAMVTRFDVEWAA
ncbi:MAG: class II aldolase/adducin family protein [Hoeflea sp.]|uniref:class II aldolase/adducin family protein n=1 Tax=Hoeflea sp. TaxID=1940281 RepID=UPI003EF9ACD3